MAVADAPQGAMTIEQRMKAMLERFEWEFEVVDLNLCFTGKYQRKLTSLAEEIGETFLPPLVNCILLSERQGTEESPFGPQDEPYAIIDGQTRRSGAMKAGVDSLPALIYKGLSTEDESAIFALIQRKRRNMTTVERFVADIEAKDPRALAIRRVLRRHKVQVGSKGKAKNTVQCVGELETTYDYAAHGWKEGELLDKTFAVLMEAWGPAEGVREDPDPDMFAGAIVRGVAKLLSDPKQEIDEKRLITRLKRTSPAKITMQAGGLRMGNGGGGSIPTYVVEVILGEYAKR